MISAGLRTFVLLISVAAAFSCSRSATDFLKTSSDIPGFGLNMSGIISTRPQTATDTVAILKLKEVALLKTVTTENGKRQVDADAAAALQKEQDEVIAKLSKLSSKIQVLYRYRMIINGIAVVTPIDQLEELRKIANVSYVETQTSFDRPVIDARAKAKQNLHFAVSQALGAKALGKTSVQFIGADQAHAKGIRGQGMKVGVLDTGIDYTHAMFGGAGTPDAFKAIDPSKETSSFPNAKVVGGIDLVGTTYDSNSANYIDRTPIIDKNPIDEGGHGSHVAGTVAGRGDGVNTYDGVAPDALLYAIKVFGAEGSTGDAVVVAGLEYAADPNADLSLDDQLDVVNLSLGSSYGNAHILYTEAMENLSVGGTVVVASAGNSGDEGYIVGAPSVADEALSVAASVDAMDQNWKFEAVRFTTVDEPSLLVEAIEGTLGKPISEISDVTGPLVYIGLADKELTPEMKAAVAGKVAFIDRGVVTFEVKVQRASEAGAIGVVVANNQPGEPIAMGGTNKYQIPTIMIKQDLGEKLKVAQTKGEVSIAFKTTEKIEKPELIDTITGFSSKGPRSNDALLKPEIAAPGALIISAEMGGGDKGVQMSGTSMAGPHMAGVMALVKQVQPTLNSRELKSMVMSTAKTMVAADKKVYPLSRQGAGRVQVMKALDAKLISYPQSISLGEVTVSARKQMRKTLMFKNISNADQSYEISFETTPGLAGQVPASLTLEAGESKTLTLDFVVSTAGLQQTSTELNGLVLLKQSGNEVSRVPVIAIANKVSEIESTSFIVRSTSKIDSQGAAVDLSLKNAGLHAGDAYLFNVLGKGARKVDPNNDPFMERGCDLQEAGYRVIEKNGVPTAQFAAKLYEPLTTWDNCEVNVLIDVDGDGVPEQELVGAKQDHLPGLTAKGFASILLDATMARELRKQFEIGTVNKEENLVEDYTDAVMNLGVMFAPTSSTIAIIEAPVSTLKTSANGMLSIRMATTFVELSAIEPDDFLKKNPKAWTSVNLANGGAAFVDLPEKITLAAGEAKTVSFAKGAGDERLLLLAPTNAPVFGGLKGDKQSIRLTPSYEVILPAVASGH